MIKDDNLTILPLKSRDKKSSTYWPLQAKSRSDEISDVSPLSPTADIFTFWMRIKGQARNDLTLNSLAQSKVSSKCLVPKIHLILLQNIIGIVKNAQIQA